MASMPVKTIPKQDIIIVPSKGECTPRFGGRAAQQHDMNDAARALLGFHDEMKIREEASKEHAVHKATSKVKEDLEMQRKSKGFLIIGVILYGIAFAAILKFLHIL